MVGKQLHRLPIISAGKRAAVIQTLLGTAKLNELDSEA